jgi:hypothetical protein
MQGRAGHYGICQLYNHIVAHRLAVNRGYGTTREYFRMPASVPRSMGTSTTCGSTSRFATSGWWIWSG